MAGSSSMTVSRSWHLCANGLLTQSAFSVACDKPQGKSDHGYRQDSAYRGHGVPKPPLAALLLRSIPADPGAALTGQRPRTETPLPARPARSVPLPLQRGHCRRQEEAVPPQRGAARTHQQEAGLLQVRRGHGSARLRSRPAAAAARPFCVTARADDVTAALPWRRRRAEGGPGPRRLGELGDIGSDTQGWIGEVHRSPQQSQPVPA